MVRIGPATKAGSSADRIETDAARTRLDAWTSEMPTVRVGMEVVCHLSEHGTTGTITPATKMVALVEWAGLRAVLANAVRFGTPDEAVTAYVADAARAITALAELRELDQLQTNGEAWLKPASAMH
ncbi:MAG: DNA-directed polymerase [Glaciihabitans sp.]|nr:DNA-directed polymerase [Glaciihabitans sp.]